MLPRFMFLVKRQRKTQIQIYSLVFYVKKINYSICLIFVAKTEIQITQVKIKVSLVTFFQRTICHAKIKVSLITFFQRTIWQVKIRVSSITFLLRTIWWVKIKVSLITFFQMTILDLIGKNQCFFNNFL